MPEFEVRAAAYDDAAEQLFGFEPLASPNRASQPRRTFRRNQFGGTFGGPVQIPKLYSGKNKTFFFFASQRYWRQGGPRQN